MNVPPAIFPENMDNLDTKERQIYGTLQHAAMHILGFYSPLYVYLLRSNDIPQLVWRKLH